MFAGDTWVICAPERTGCTDCETEELRVPTTRNHFIVTRQLGGRVLANVRCGLVILRVQLERPSGDGLLLIGLLDGQIDRVLDAEAQS